MRSILAAAAAIVAASLWLPGQAAKSEPPSTAPAASADTISFEQYRAWRLHFIEQRQTQLAIRLAAPDLRPADRARLEQQKAYYDWFAGLPDADRDHRFRERFDQIDANHDGIIDPAERSAWHEKQQAYYGHARGARTQTAARTPE